jgi:hypothetical protein
MADFHFVEGHLPHGPRDSISISAIKSHVRRANLERASLASDFRSLTTTDFVMGRTRGRRRWTTLPKIRATRANESVRTHSPSPGAYQPLTASPTTGSDYSIASEPTLPSLQQTGPSSPCPNWLAANGGQLDLWQQQVHECLYYTQSPVHLAVGANWVDELVSSCEFLPDATKSCIHLSQVHCISQRSRSSQQSMMGNMSTRLPYLPRA